MNLRIRICSCVVLFTMLYWYINRYKRDNNTLTPCIIKKMIYWLWTCRWCSTCQSTNNFNL